MDKEERQQTTSTDESGGMLDMAQRMLMASLGAVALAQEEAEDFVNRLVERGGLAEKDGRKLLNDLIEWRRQGVADMQEGVSTAVSGTVGGAHDLLTRRLEAAVDALNIPKKSDIDALSDKINLLIEKVDQIKQARKK